MNIPIDKKYILNFLKEEKVGILSTINKKSLPDAAPIFFVTDNNFCTYFITPAKSQKFMNIKNQPEVVLTVTNESKKETFQLRGKAKEEKKLLSDILLHLTEKLNNDKNFTSTLPALNYKNQDKTVIKIKPYQIRMRKYNDNELEEKVIEISELDIK